MFSIGIDISKTTFDCVILANNEIHHQQFPNALAGFKALSKWIFLFSNLFDRKFALKSALSEKCMPKLLYRLSRFVQISFSDERIFKTSNRMFRVPTFNSAGPSSDFLTMCGPKKTWVSTET